MRGKFTAEWSMEAKTDLLICQRYYCFTVSVESQVTSCVRLYGIFDHLRIAIVFNKIFAFNADYEF